MKTKTLTRTAVMLALTLAFQALRFIPFIAALPINPYIIGTLVNFALFVTTASVGLGAAIFISIAAPVVAFLQGHLPFPLLIPVVAAGNCILCVLYYYVRKINKYAGVVVSAVGKWVFLYFGGKFVLQTLIKPPAAKLAVLVAAYNLPQIVTAVLGGLLALLVLRALKLKDVR